MRSLIQICIIVCLSFALIIAGSYLLAKTGDPQTPEPGEMMNGITLAPTQNTVVEPASAETAATVPAQDAAQSISVIPKYYQTDYPHYAFGNGTIATSGCSITCLAMVGTYLTDHAYYPDQMAYHFGDFGKNNIERLDYGCRQMQLPYTRSENAVEVLDALEEGKVAIVMMDDESVFTSEQHFILLAGMTEDGKVIVHDPLEPLHSHETYMRNSFQDGFEPHNVMRGFSGAWIFDKNSMPAEPFVFDADIPDADDSRYGSFEISGEDHYLLACFLWAEARDQSPQVQQAIAEVILNRVFSDQFPNTIRDVIYKGEYYSLTEKMKYADPQDEQFDAIYTATYGEYLLPENVFYFSVWETNGDAWGTIGPYTFLHSR